MILDQLLKEIRAGGTFHPAVLASRLNVSVDLVEMMLEDLERKGMLVTVNSSCDTTCGGCPFGDGCQTQNGKARLWRLAQS